MRARLWMFVLTACVCSTCPGDAAYAADCSISAPTLVFGLYDTYNSLDSVTSVTVTCSLTPPASSEVVSYTVSLSSGPGSYNARQMASGGGALTYNIYVDAARSVIWGDGTAGTSKLSGTLPTLTTQAPTQNYSHSAYGRIPGNQDVTAGTYLTVTPLTMTLDF